jgi:hypothetical protein
MGAKKFLGRLTGLVEDLETGACVVTLRPEDKAQKQLPDEIHIPYEMIASARLEVEF